MKTWHTATWLIVTFMILFFGVGSVQAKDTELSEAESKRLSEIITEAKEARTKGDLERVADLLRQAIDINPAPSFRWNLARIYEDLCRYPGAAEQFKALESDKAVNQELRAKAKLRLRGLERYLSVPSYRVRIKTEGARLYINGIKVELDAESKLLDKLRGVGPAGMVYHLELHADGSFRTRIRSVEASLNRCITIDDDLDANAPELGLVRLNLTQPIRTLELHSEAMGRLRVRADLKKLRELELPPGNYTVESRTTEGDLMSADLALEAGGTVDVFLAKGPRTLKTTKEPSGVTSPGLVAFDGGFRMTSDSWGWITTGASLALVAAGVWARLDADRLFDEYTRVWKEEIASQQLSQAQIFERYETIIHRETTAWVLVGIGAAGAVAGTILLLSDDGPSTTGSVDYLGSSFTVTPGLDGSVQMQLRF